MRDPNRIDPFLQELGTIWKEECPDWRFGQFISNVILDHVGHNVWYMQDDEALELINEYFKWRKTKKEENHDV